MFLTTFTLCAANKPISQKYFDLVVNFRKIFREGEKSFVDLTKHFSMCDESIFRDAVVVKQFENSPYFQACKIQGQVP